MVLRWCLLLLSSCLIGHCDYRSLLTHEGSPILYGGILSGQWKPLALNNSDLEAAVKFAVERRKGSSNFNIPTLDDGTVIIPRIVKASKLVLEYTEDDLNPSFVTLILKEHPDGRVVTQKRAVIVGVMYDFQLMWPKAVMVGLHRFLVTIDRNRQYFLYGHTYYDGDISSMLSQCMKDKSCSHQFNIPNKWTNPALWQAHNLEFSNEYLSAFAHKHEDSQQRNGMLADIGNSRFRYQTFALSNNQLKIATYNLWNFNGYDEGVYKNRMDQFGKLCQQNDADIFGFQEVRFDFNKQKYKGPSQVEHLSEFLPQYQFMFQPAMSYPEQAFDRVEEGVSIFSRYPIVNHSYILLSRDLSDTGDTHQRICLHVEVETPQLQRVHIFNTHLSLSEKARNRNVLEMWSFIQAHSKPWILMGDLNAEPHSKAMRFLAGLETIEGISTKGFQDAWTALYPEPRPGAPGAYTIDEARDPGLTFSTLEETLVKRIDYLFLALDGRADIEVVDLIDDGIRWDGVTSDHLGVSVTLNVTKS